LNAPREVRGAEALDLIQATITLHRQRTGATDPEEFSLIGVYG